MDIVDDIYNLDKKYKQNESNGTKKNRLYNYDIFTGEIPILLSSAHFCLFEELKNYLIFFFETFLKHCKNFLETFS